jgi:hypothetical protein
VLPTCQRPPPGEKAPAGSHHEFHVVEVPKVACLCRNASCRMMPQPKCIAAEPGILDACNKSHQIFAAAHLIEHLHPSTK